VTGIHLFHQTVEMQMQPLPLNPVPVIYLLGMARTQADSQGYLPGLDSITMANTTFLEHLEIGGLRL
jgi:hypothetical protein